MADDDGEFAAAIERASLRVSQLLQVKKKKCVFVPRKKERKERKKKKKTANFTHCPLQFPEHLDKIDQHRIRLLRKKATVDARLKSSVQSQLDDTTNGLELLRK